MAESVLIKFIATALFIVYLSLSPVYWLPSISPELLRLIKLVLIAMALIIIFLRSNKQFMRIFSEGLFGFLGFFLVVLVSVPGFLASDMSDTINVLISYSLVFLMLWGAYAYYGMVPNPNNLLIVSAILMAAVCSVIVLYFLIGFPNFKPPAIYETESLRTAGFGAKRTGWSNGISLFVPLSFLLLVAKRKHSFLRQFVAYSCPLLIVTVQLIVAGRGGLVASFIGLSMVTLYVLPKRLLLPFSVVLLLLFMGGFYLYSAQNSLGSGDDISSDLKTHFRLDRLESNKDNALDRFSAGRVGQYACAWEYFVQRPITGYGFTLQNNCMGDSIHNLWVRLAVQGGVFLFLFLFVFVFRVVKKLSRNYFLLSKKKESHLEEQKRITVIYLAVIFQGLFISLVEPKALIGSFQATAIWWVVLGFSLFHSASLLGQRARKKSMVTRAKTISE